MHEDQTSNEHDDESVRHSVGTFDDEVRAIVRGAQEANIEELHRRIEELEELLALSEFERVTAELNFERQQRLAASAGSALRVIRDTRYGYEEEEAEQAWYFCLVVAQNAKDASQALLARWADEDAEESDADEDE